MTPVFEALKANPNLTSDEARAAIARQLNNEAPEHPSYVAPVVSQDAQAPSAPVVAPNPQQALIDAAVAAALKGTKKK